MNKRLANTTRERHLTFTIATHPPRRDTYTVAHLRTTSESGFVKRFDINNASPKTPPSNWMAGIPPSRRASIAEFLADLDCAPGDDDVFLPPQDSNGFEIRYLPHRHATRRTSSQADIDDMLAEIRALLESPSV
ncbi:MAG: hypothetical protein O3A01_00340 [bacterium]|nr:hypothetical protein [bacterium]